MITGPWTAVLFVVTAAFLITAAVALWDAVEPWLALRRAHRLRKSIYGVVHEHDR